MVKKGFIFIALLFVFSIAAAQDNADTNQTDADGMKFGTWEAHYPSGQLRYSGQFLNDKPTGEFRYFYVSGQLRATNQFSMNGRKAYNRVFSEAGTMLAEGLYFDQLKDSVWRIYSEADGKLIAEETYKENVLHGESKTYYPQNDQLAELALFENGLRQGKAIRWFEDGKLLSEINYQDDQMQGPAVYYHPNGKIQFQGNYLNGRKDGLWKTYDEGENLIEEAMHKAD